MLLTPLLREKRVWINQNLSKTWAKPCSTTEDREVVIIYTGITKRGEFSNLTLSKGIIRKASPSAAAERKGQKEHSQISSKKSTHLANHFHVHGCKGTASFCRCSLPWSPTGAEEGHEKCHRPVFQAKEQQPFNGCKATASNARATTKHQQKPNGDEQKHALVSTAICPSSLVVLHIDLLFQIPDFQK